MPQLPDVPLYQGNQPYHWEFDNLPIIQLIANDQLLSDAIDINTSILEDAIGTQGTLANRLNQALNPDGSLIPSEIDAALHNIGAHQDGLFSGISYVRMLNDERNKLAGISVDATNFSLQVVTPSTSPIFNNGQVTLEPSSSVAWEVTGSNQIRANLGFPLSAAHQHYYEVEPTTGDHQNFAIPYAFNDGSLRVFVNGIRINSDSLSAVYVPPADVITNPWALLYFTPNATAGTFSLNSPVTSSDIVRVDFDIQFTL